MEVMLVLCSMQERGWRNGEERRMIDRGYRNVNQQYGMIDGILPTALFAQEHGLCKIGLFVML